MKEGRIRPSFQPTATGTQQERPAAMKEGRIRPSFRERERERERVIGPQ